MPAVSTLKYVVDVVIRRNLADFGTGTELHTALDRTYPFSDDPIESAVWLETSRRYNIECPLAGCC